MLPNATLPVPASLMSLLAGFAPLFTAPSLRTFCGLACGFLAQTRTVCGMLAGAGFVAGVALAMSWYAVAGHDPADVQARCARAPWYTAKTQPAAADMLAKLRRVIIAARFNSSRPDQPTPEEIHTIRLAWEDLAS